MAQQELWYADQGPLIFEDTDVGRYTLYPALETRAALISQAYATETPVHDWELVRLEDLAAAVAGLNQSVHVAGEILGGNRVVRIAGDNKAWYADRTAPAYADAIYGLTLGAAALGGNVTVQYFGIINEPSWTWTSADPLFLSTTGLLTQTAPTVGFLLIVGFALTATRILFSPKGPIILV